ncbi:flagellin [Barrientosiimonas marina]|uniref:Flagellin n=1 Tax=Lentibacillus kimchii TaxID=1542911 RepID=A0ABW2UXD2_9BACI
MQINHNIAALNTQNQLQQNNNATQSSLEKLSSGMKINKAGDDAAGLAISEKMRGQIKGLEMAEKNAQDGISLVQTAEGAMNESHAILQRMRELSVQSANDSNSPDDREKLQNEVDQLSRALDDISNDTEFNGKKLLNGDFAKGNKDLTFHVGANEGQNLAVNIDDMSASSLNVGGIDGAQFEVTENTNNNIDQGKYSVVELEDGATVKDGTGSPNNTANVSYALQNENGDIAAVSDDGGKTYKNLQNNESIDDLASGTLDTGGSATTDFGGDPVISGTVNSTASGATATATVSSGVDLADGTYTVVDDSHGDVDSGESGLQNDQGDVVAISGTDAGGDKGKIWKSFSDTSETVLDTDSKVDAGEEIKVGSGDGLNISTQTSADAAIDTIQGAIDDVSAERSKLGAVQNRLDHTINNLSTSSENMTAAESRIRDTDMASEMMEFTKNNILSQASQSMLAQAQQRPQGVLQLLQ